MDQEKDRLIKECRRLQKNSLWTATSYFSAAEMLGWLHLLGGSLPIVLGGVGSWKLLSDSQSATPNQIFFAGLATLMAGIIGGLMSFLNLTKTRQEHFSAGTKYKTLENEFRRCHEIHVLSEDQATFKERVIALCEKYDQTGEASVLSSSLSLWLTRKKIGNKVFEDAPHNLSSR